MNQFYQDLTKWITIVSENIWWFMLPLLFIVGVLMTVRTGMIQVRHLGTSFRLTFAGFFGKKSKLVHEGDISPFAALSTALAATIGNGNIGGVATALVSGGPGAIFWLWVCGFIGMALKYSEALLGVKFREKHPDGTIAGGPMYYIKNGFKNKKLAAFLAPAFAVCGTIATLFGTGNMMQSNQMTMAFESVFGISKWIMAVVITVLVGIVIIGGIKRIGMVAEKVVPGMLVLFFVFGTVVLIINITAIPAAFALIVKYAFTPHAAAGGFLGASVKMALQFGFRRGLLTNEAGLGSAPIAHATAQTPSPVHQGLLGVCEVFIDTLAGCTFTAIVLLATGVWTSGLDGTAMAAASFKAVPLGPTVVAICAFLFGYATLLGWCFYGEQCAKYLFGIKITYPYRILFIILCFIGAVSSIQLVFFLGDIVNALMALPNLIALVVLSGLVSKITKDFWKKYKTIEDYDGAPL